MQTIGAARYTDAAVKAAYLPRYHGRGLQRLLAESPPGAFTMARIGHAINELVRLAVCA